MDKRLRDTLSGLMPSRTTGAAKPAPPSDKTPLPVPPAATSAPAPRPKHSSDTDVDKILSDTFGPSQRTLKMCLPRKCSSGRKRHFRLGE
jgi:hypothetical protein